MINSLATRYAASLAALEDDKRWFDCLTGVSLGDEVASPTPMDSPAQRFENLGFTCRQSPTYRREVDLLAPIELVPTHATSLPQIDCIAIISVMRSHQGPQYLYDSLRSLSTQLPEGAQFNIVVGNAQTDYVSPARLRAEIGSYMASCAHVVAVDVAASEYMARNFNLQRRGGWNYARTLLNYKGTRGLLLLEDDIEWAKGALEKLDLWLNRRNLPAISLYNRVDSKPPDPQEKRRLGQLIRADVLAARDGFHNTQAMYFSAYLTRELARYMLLRLHYEPYDHLLRAFLVLHQLAVGYAYPSLVQHTGKESTGLGFHHQSACYVGSS